MAQTRKKPKSEHAHLVVRMDLYEAEASAAVNDNAYAP